MHLNPDLRQDDDSGWGDGRASTSITPAKAGVQVPIGGFVVCWAMTDRQHVRMREKTRTLRYDRYSAGERCLSR